MPFRYFINLSYHGASYCGWQRQPNALTVQQMLEDAISTLFGINLSLTGCGRTDTGVHAADFFAHFDSDEHFSAERLENMTFRLNRYLPPDIAIHYIRPVAAGVHARFSALCREYHYTVIRQKDPFLFKDACFMYGDLNIGLMNQCALTLKGIHDFKSFSKVHTQVKHYNCEVYEARWDLDGHVLTFTIRADRFLRNMVRAVVGTLLDVGKGKLPAEDFAAVIAGRNRSDAGQSAPAAGLKLVAVNYPEGIFSPEPQWFSEQSFHKEEGHDQAHGKFHESAGQETDE